MIIYIFNKEFTIPRIVRIKISMRSTKSLMGRFGGGWDWEVGFRASRNFRSVIINLLVVSIRFYFFPKKGDL